MHTEKWSTTRKKLKIPKVSLFFLLISFVVMVTVNMLPGVINGHVTSSFFSLSLTFLTNDIFTISGLFLYPFYVGDIFTLLKVGFFLILFGLILETETSPIRVFQTILISTIIAGLIFLVSQLEFEELNILASPWTIVYGYSTGILGIRLKQRTLFDKSLLSLLVIFLILLAFVTVGTEIFQHSLASRGYLIGAMLASFLLNYYGSRRLVPLDQKEETNKNE